MNNLSLGHLKPWVVGVGITVALFFATEVAFVTCSILKIESVVPPTLLNGAIYLAVPYLLCALVFWPLLAKILHILVPDRLVIVGTFSAIGYALGIVLSLYNTDATLSPDFKTAILSGRLLLVIAFPVWCIVIDRFSRQTGRDGNANK